MRDSTVVQGREPFSTSATRLEAPKQHCDNILYQECKTTSIHTDLARPRSRIVFLLPRERATLTYTSADSDRVAPGKSV